MSIIKSNNYNDCLSLSRACNFRCFFVSVYVCICEYLKGIILIYDCDKFSKIWLHVNYIARMILPFHLIYKSRLTIHSRRSVKTTFRHYFCHFYSFINWIFFCILSKILHTVVKLLRPFPTGTRRKRPCNG